jgi:tetrahydromethanopterin S-methyltransferase subunit G
VAERDRTEDITQQITAPPGAEDRSVKEIIEALRPQVQELVDRQVAMARAELEPVGRQAGKAIGLLVGGAVFMLLFLTFLCVTVIYLLNEVAGLSLWLSALIVTGGLLGIGAVLLLAGRSGLQGLDPKPHRTLAAARQNVEWLKGQLRR